jgi:hypothetical protein
MTLEIRQPFYIFIGLMIVSIILVVGYANDYVNFGNNYVEQRLITLQDNPYMSPYELDKVIHYELTGNEIIAGNLSFVNYQSNYTPFILTTAEFGGCADLYVTNCTGKMFCKPKIVIENFTFNGYGTAYESMPCYNKNTIVHSHPIIKNAGLFVGGANDTCVFSNGDKYAFYSNKQDPYNEGVGQRFSVLVCDKNTIKIATTDGYNAYYGFRYPLNSILQYLKFDITKIGTVN